MQLFLFAVIGVLTVCSSASYAQDMMIGERGGLNFANQAWDGSDFGNNSERTGILAGGQLDVLMGNGWALSLQALYDQKGTEGELFTPAIGPPPAKDGTENWKISYLEISLFVKMNFGFGDIRPYVFAGPSLGVLLSNIERLQTNGYYYLPNPPGLHYPTDTTVDISDSTKRIDFSIVAGAGISLRIESDVELFLYACYGYGLVNIDNYVSDKANGFTVFSRDIRVAAGILFPIK